MHTFFRKHAVFRFLKVVAMAAVLSGATRAFGQGLVFSEIMYNSGPPDGDKYDFIELCNAGTNQLDLAGTSFFGVAYRFTNSTVLALSLIHI